MSLLFDILTTNYHYFCIKSKQPHAACFLSLSTSNPAFPSLHFGSLPAFSLVQHTILLFFLCVLDLCLLFTLSNVQSCSSSSAFWTSACFSPCPMSNLALLSLHFGPLPAFQLVQRPILLFFLCILDLCLLFLLSNVQSTSPIQKFWTFPNNINAKSPKHHNHMMFWTSALYNLIYMSNQRLPIQHQALARLICLKNKQVPPFKLTTLSTFSFCFCNCSACLYADMLLPVYN